MSERTAAGSAAIEGAVAQAGGNPAAGPGAGAGTGIEAGAGGGAGAGAMLQAVDLTRRFGGLAAVNRVSIDLRRGEVHAVIGTNGAGK